MLPQARPSGATGGMAPDFEGRIFHEAFGCGRVGPRRRYLERAVARSGNARAIAIRRKARPIPGTTSTPGAARLIPVIDRRVARTTGVMSDP